LPSASSFGLSVIFPVTSLILPYTSCSVPSALSLMLDFMTSFSWYDG
jgi:hypothetical protein